MGTSGPSPRSTGPALVARRVEAGTAGDRAGVGVGGDRPGLGGEFGGRDDVQPGHAQEDQVGRFRQEPRQGEFGPSDLILLGPQVGNQVGQDGLAEGGPVVGLGGVPSPGEDRLEGAPETADAGAAHGGGQLVEWGHAECGGGVVERQRTSRSQRRRYYQRVPHTRA